MQDREIVYDFLIKKTEWLSLELARSHFQAVALDLPFVRHVCPAIR